MKPINAFQTSDGKIFSDQLEAEKYEIFLSKREVIERFLDTDENPYISIPHRAIARNSIVAWESWKIRNVK